MSMRNYLGCGVAALSVATVLVAPAYAQETTSSVRGTVESASGPVANATVTVTHEPSGTTSTATTDASGGFSTSGLRVGGPFSVTVDADGFESSKVTDIYLQAGTPLRLPISLETQAEIVVTASSIKKATETSNGPITALNREDIEGVASINRDIRDLARRDPLVTMDLSNARTIEIAGNNGRLNKFSVDGVQFSDDFGLNNGGLPTSRGPVPFDAIEQFSVKVAPYDISEGDFQGGAINVILRSGGNKFRGNAFFTYTSDSLTGDKTRSTTQNPTGVINLDFDSKQYGATLSGPIIKDKLFFMMSYEKVKEKDPFDDGVGAGFANQVPNLTQAQIDNISNIANSVYGYNTLGQIQNATEEDEKFIAKLDWNITEDQRASLTYIRNVGTQQFQQNTSISTQSPSIGLFSNGYELAEEVNSGVFQLNSQWSDKFSTEFRASYRDYNRGQTPFGGRDFAQFSVCLDPTTVGTAFTACTPGTPTVNFGPDISRQANALNTENLSMDFTAKLDAGDHQIKFTAGYTDSTTLNLFLQRATGDYYFDSVADFQNRIASRLRYGNAVPSLDPNDAAASFGTQNFTIGLQDDWDITPDFTLTYGMRYDLFNNDKYPPLNPNFAPRYGYSNRESFSGKSVFQPRFGFNWRATDRLVVRGGAGIFSGGTPDVFLSNSFSNTGLLTNAIDLSRTATGPNFCNVPTTGLTPAQQLAICQGALLNISGTTINPAVNSFLATNTASLAQAPTNAIVPDLRIARKLKASLQADYEADLGPLGDGWFFGAQILYDENIWGYQWTDVRSTAIGTLPDGRPRYNVISSTPGSTNQDLLMTNSTRGRSWFGSLRMEKRFGPLTIDGSYTRANVKDENALTSSTASSLYSNNAFSDPNFAAYGRSIYEIKDQWKFGLDFSEKFFGDYKTRFSLFGEYRTGRPYSFTMATNAGGTRSPIFGTVGNNGRMLLYVPTIGDTKVSFTDAATEAAFNALVTNNGLEKYRGKIVPKNTNNSPDFFKIDLHAEQELPGFFGGAKFKVFGDIENVLNMIDKDWGSLRQQGFPYTNSAVLVQCLSAPVATGTAPAAAQINTAPTQNCVQYRYSSVQNPNIATVSRQSLYAIRVGIRFSF
jgi:Carboxypeptidase regulatory-like domain